MLREFRDASDYQHERTRHDSRSFVLGGDRFDGLPVSSNYRNRNRLDLSGLAVRATTRFGVAILLSRLNWVFLHHLPYAGTGLLVPAIEATTA